MKRLYISAPYTNKDKRVVATRVHLADKMAGYLMEKGYCVFSPLSHSHPIAQKMKRNNFDHDFWLNQDIPFIEWADELWIMCLPGWKESRGVRREIKEAKRIGISIKIINEWDIYRIVNL